MNKPRVTRWFGINYGLTVGMLLIGLSGLSSAVRGQGRGQAMRQLPDVVGGYASDSIIIRLAPGKISSQLNRPQAAKARAVQHRWDRTPPAQLSPAFHTQWQRWGITRMERVLKYDLHDSQTAAALGLDRYFVLTVPLRSDTPAMAKAFAGLRGEIEHAELNDLGGVSGLIPGQTQLIPNDTEFCDQYNMHNEGDDCFGNQIYTPDADIDAPEAWAIHTGDLGTVTIGIIDSGVSPHPDFGDRLLPGYNAITQSPGGDTTDAACPHGTHVTGIATAKGNNGSGVAGVTWGANILPVRIFSACFGSEDTVADGIIWAVNEGADILNMSIQFCPSSLGGLNGFGNVQGLAYDPNTDTFYGTDISADRLITVDPFSGEGTAIGSLGFLSVQGLAFDPNSNILYGADNTTNKLITINTTTGAGTGIGLFGLSDVQGLAFDSITNTLYGITSFGQLLTINTATGVATLIGSTGFNQVEGLAFDSTSQTLYGVDNSSSLSAKLFTINKASGASTMVGDLGFRAVKSLTFDTSSSVLHGVNTSTDRFLLIDPATGTTSILGLLASAVKFAESQGVFMAAAAGNDNGCGFGVVAAPAAFPEVVAVSATNADDEFARSFIWESNFGPEIELSAPGDFVRSTFINNRFANLNGTSMASPHVAGLAALIKSFNINITAAEIRQTLQESSDDLLFDPNTRQDTLLGRDIYYGFGRINAYQALRQAGPFRILASLPADGSIDARQPSQPDGSNPQGWDTILLFFAGGRGIVSSIPMIDFSITQLGGSGSPVPMAIFPDDISGTITMFLDRPITSGTRTTITHVPSGSSITLGYLPGDVDGNGATDVGDIALLLDALDGSIEPPPPHSVDIDRSIALNAPDLLRLIDLMLGAGDYPPYFGAVLP